MALKERNNYSLSFLSCVILSKLPIIIIFIIFIYKIYRGEVLLLQGVQVQQTGATKTVSSFPRSLGGFTDQQSRQKKKVTLNIK